MSGDKKITQKIYRQTFCVPISFKYFNSSHKFFPERLKKIHYEFITLSSMAFILLKILGMKISFQMGFTINCTIF